MANFKVSCVMVPKSYFGPSIHVELVGAHPDVVKCAISKKYPSHFMTAIKIEDVRPKPKQWSDR
jgi:hypothetical protein